MNVLELYRSKGLDAKKVGSTHGGEWAGACPGCGGEDRFRIWPEQNSGSGSFWCRGCETAGDRVTFLMAFEGMSYPQACESLDIRMEKQEYRTPVVPRKSQTPNLKPKTNPKLKKQSSKPSNVWMEQAEKLAGWAHSKLMENDEQLAWLAARGIDRDAVVRCRLGWNPGKDGRDLWRPRESWGLATEMKENKFGKMVKKKLWIPRGIVIPWPAEAPARIRIRRPEGEPRYYVLPGSDMEMMLLQVSGVRCQGKAVLVIESELDAIMCHAQSGGMCLVLALGSSSAKPDENLMEILRNAAVIPVSLDYDAAGEKAMAWWTHQFHQVKLWPVPEGTDPGESFRAEINIKEWIRAGLPEAWRIGQSLLDNKNRSGPVEPAGVKQISAVDELGELLKQHPVTVHNLPNRTYIAAPVKWQQQNWGVYQRISGLVFLNPEVFRYISAHPETKITGRNLILDG